ncbi:hypothetical protein PISMIDRAFT_678285 [Pisolithus microcarpus 441]|uniref:Unplaced genomic scaffold scaffold_32, whole genome shotgun sequence n=1 Tax=Pisolithus microcarpus 441 TaxID=765257 RepID=A0A0C9ZES8_9AGAM|nr:hypothetical protein PISMIDRAFT_678285 [Pisolithus microcarpus 441]
MQYKEITPDRTITTCIEGVTSQRTSDFTDSLAVLVAIVFHDHFTMHFLTCC